MGGKYHLNLVNRKTLQKKKKKKMKFNFVVISFLSMIGVETKLVQILTICVCFDLNSFFVTFLSPFHILYAVLHIVCNDMV